MSRSDFYASPFGAAYSAYMERPRLSRLVGRVVWGADVRPYYESMAAVAEVPRGSTVVEIPLPDASADLFLSYWGLHCFGEPAAALAEASRVLKPGARLVGSTFVTGSESLRQRLLVRPGAGDFGRVSSAEDVAGWLGQAGFADPAIRRSGPMMFFAARLCPLSGRRTERLVDERAQ